MTSSPETLGPCQESAGFLFSHDCPRRAHQQCLRCQKPICTEHAHPLQDGVHCTTCARAHLQTPKAARQLGAPPKGSDLHPLLFPSYYYRGHGYYGQGAWGHELLQDPHDFTEADGEALRQRKATEHFEEDMEGS